LASADHHSMNSFVVVDVETTGLDSNVEHVIELAALRFSDDAIVNSYSTYVATERDIPPEVSAVHGITHSDVKFAPLWSDVQRRLVSFMRPGELVVAHHAEFDRAFLPCLDASYVGVQRTLCATFVAERTGV